MECHINSGSTAYVTFIDDSRAFDRLALEMLTLQF